MARQEDDMDVLCAPWGLTHINWREHGPRDDPNPVAPSDWTQHSIHHSFSGPRSAFATDVDHYGETDIVAAVRTDNDIISWQNLRSQSFARHIMRRDFLGAESAPAPGQTGMEMRPYWPRCGGITQLASGRMTATRSSPDTSLGVAYRISAIRERRRPPRSPGSFGARPRSHLAG
jgi:hypothetical protein